MDSLIKNMEYLTQPIDFTGMQLKEDEIPEGLANELKTKLQKSKKGKTLDQYLANCFPTNIDAIMDIFGYGYILIESKCGIAEIPTGQGITLVRLMEDTTLASKPGVIIVAEHGKEIPVDLATCMVRQIKNGLGRMCVPYEPITVKEAMIDAVSYIWKEHTKHIAEMA